jgi:hypothetical protein
VWFFSLSATSTCTIVTCFWYDAGNTRFLIPWRKSRSLFHVLKSSVIFTQLSHCSCSSMLVDMHCNVLTKDSVLTLSPNSWFLCDVLCHLSAVLTHPSVRVSHCLCSWRCRPSTVWVILHQLTAILEAVLPLKHCGLRHNWFAVHCPKLRQHFYHQFFQPLVEFGVSSLLELIHITALDPTATYYSVPESYGSWRTAGTIHVLTYLSKLEPVCHYSALFPSVSQFSKGTMLQAGRSRVQFLMRSLDFFQLT